MDIKKLYRAKPYLPKEDRQWIQAAWRRYTLYRNVYSREVC